MKRIILIIFSLIILQSFDFVEKKTYVGTVKFFNENKGYGTLIYKNEELYTSAELIIDEINKGDKVVFLAKNSKRGFIAYDVRVVK